MQPRELVFELRYVGWEAERHRLNIYDAGKAIEGMSRTLALCTHYFVNGDIITQATALSGAEIFLTAPEAGSIKFRSIIRLLRSPWAATIAVGLVTNAIYDVTKAVVQTSVGQNIAITDAHAKQIIKHDISAIDTIADRVTNDLANIHRPLNSSAELIYFGGQSSQITLNEDTYEYVKTTRISEGVYEFVGRVAAYNANSQKGRIYIPEINRVIPFEPDEYFSPGQSQELADSLAHYVRAQGRSGNKMGYVTIYAKKMETGSGLLRRLIVVGLEGN